MSDNGYDEHLRTDKLYMSPSLPAFGHPDRRVRIANKAFHADDDFAFGTIKKETVIRQTEGHRKYLKATFFEDNRGIRVLNIQGFSAATDKPHNASFAFIGEEISTLVEFINAIRAMPLEDEASVNAFDSTIRKRILSKEQATALLNQNEKVLAEALLDRNEEVLAEALRSKVTKEDIVAVGYRKRQLDIFRKLLDEPAYFQECSERLKLKGEAMWQRFFERNTWMFGYGLGYLFLSALDEKKLEQVVQGFDMATYGKRVDGVMKSRGAISNLCFIEIKTHETPLLAAKSYRVGCWAPSGDLAGAVAQVQGTVHSAVESLGARFNGADQDGNPSGEEAFNFQPKSYLVIGNLKQFITEHGVNQEHVKSFELYRRSTSNPEIITFDELYERARFIVNHNG